MHIMQTRIQIHLDTSLKQNLKGLSTQNISKNFKKILTKKKNKQVWVDARRHKNRKYYFGTNLSHKIFFVGVSSTGCYTLSHYFAQ